MIKELIPNVGLRIKFLENLKNYLHSSEVPDGDMSVSILMLYTYIRNLQPINKITIVIAYIL